MARNEVFVDTSSLYALVERKDTHHIAAREIVSKLVRAGRTLIVSDYVVAETLNLANARSGSYVALRVIDFLEQSAGIRVEWIGAARFDATKTFFRKHSDYPYSFTDCSSFVVMRDLRLSSALTTDGHFSEAGFDALLSG